VMVMITAFSLLRRSLGSVHMPRHSITKTIWLNRICDNFRECFVVGDLRNLCLCSLNC
jgi:hypothetical protein